MRRSGPRSSTAFKRHCAVDTMGSQQTSSSLPASSKASTSASSYRSATPRILIAEKAQLLGSPQGSDGSPGWSGSNLGSAAAEERRLRRLDAGCHPSCLSDAGVSFSGASSASSDLWGVFRRQLRRVERRANLPPDLLRRERSSRGRNARLRRRRGGRRPRSGAAGGQHLEDFSSGDITTSASSATSREPGTDIEALLKSFLRQAMTDGERAKAGADLSSGDSASSATDLSSIKFQQSLTDVEALLKAWLRGDTVKRPKRRHRAARKDVADRTLSGASDLQSDGPGPPEVTTKSRRGFWRPVVVQSRPAAKKSAAQFRKLGGRSPKAISGGRVPSSKSSSRTTALDSKGGTLLKSFGAKRTRRRSASRPLAPSAGGGGKEFETWSSAMEARRRKQRQPIYATVRPLSVRDKKRSPGPEVAGRWVTVRSARPSPKYQTVKKTADGKKSTLALEPIPPIILESDTFRKTREMHLEENNAPKAQSRSSKDCSLQEHARVDSTMLTSPMGLSSTYPKSNAAVCSEQKLHRDKSTGRDRRKKDAPPVTSDKTSHQQSLTASKLGDKIDKSGGPPVVGRTRGIVPPPPANRNLRILNWLSSQPF